MIKSLLYSLEIVYHTFKLTGSGSIFTISETFWIPDKFIQYIILDQYRLVLMRFFGHISSPGTHLLNQVDFAQDFSQLGQEFKVV